MNENMNQGLQKGTSLSLALGIFPCRMGMVKYSEVWDLLAAPDSLVFGPAGVKGRGGLFM